MGSYPLHSPQRPDFWIQILDTTLAVHLETNFSHVGLFERIRLRDFPAVHPNARIRAVGNESKLAPISVAAAQVVCRHSPIDTAGWIGRTRNIVNLDFVAPK